MTGIKATIKTTFDKRCAYTLLGGTIGALTVLFISNVLQDAPNLFQKGGAQ
jgi:hypothetical protein